MTEAKSLEDENAKTFTENDKVHLPTGALTVRQLRTLLNSLPFELDFIDENNCLAYFSDEEKRIYPRQRAFIGKSILEVYPEELRTNLQKVLDSFHEGAASHYEEWFPLGESVYYINYYALRDIDGTYLGAMTFTGDITRIQGFRGVRTLNNSTKTE